MPGIRIIINNYTVPTTVCANLFASDLEACRNYGQLVSEFNIYLYKYSTDVVNEQLKAIEDSEKYKKKNLNLNGYTINIQLLKKY